MGDSTIYEDGSYEQQNEGWHVEDSPWKAAKIRSILEKNKIHPKTIAEIGCGAGEILSQLKDSMDPGIEFSGYEISPQAFRMAEQRTAERLNFYLQDFLETALHPDVLLIIDVIEHVPDLYGFLDKLRTHARYKIFHIPLDLSAQTVLRSQPIMAGRKKLGHIHYFTRDTAIASLEDRGYEIIDSFYTAGMVELKNKPLKTRLLKFPRQLLFSLNPHLASRLLGGYSLLVLAK